MNIGRAAARTGLPAKTIRYYEDIGLITADRAANGYRDFSDTAVHQLVFISRARALGFGIDDCRNLLTLWADKDRASADVRTIAKGHLDDISAKIDALRSMQSTLQDLVTRCSGSDRPDCPILDGLEQDSSAD